LEVSAPDWANAVVDWANTAVDWQDSPGDCVKPAAAHVKAAASHSKPDADCVRTSVDRSHPASIVPIELSIASVAALMSVRRCPFEETERLYRGSQCRRNDTDGESASRVAGFFFPLPLG